MRTCLHVEEQHHGKVFTSQEAVRGSVNLELHHSTAISSLVLSLKGRLITSLHKNYTSFTLGEGIDPLVCDIHKVFKLSKVLFPSSSIPVPGGYTLCKGRHSFPFAISFPLLSACEPSQSLVRHLEAALPPSFDSHTSDRSGSAKIDYILKVKVKRQSRFHWNTSTHQELFFLSSDPPLSSIPPCLSATTSGILYLYDIVPTRQPTTSAQHSAGRHPILRFEARLPSSAILYAGDKVPLILLLHKFPAKPDGAIPIQLRSIFVSLQSTTMVAIGSDRTSWTSSRNLLQLTDLGGTLADSQSVLSKLSSGMLQDITIPNITSSFTTCTIRHEHSLEITGGFSLDNHAKLSLVKLVINVEIYSGVGRNLDVILPGPGAEYERGPRIPIRPGCLEHLRVNGGFTEDSPPPTYHEPEPAPGD